VICGGHHATLFIMPFHSDPELRAAFQGYQGPDPTGCRLIFVGKDANYPPWRESPLSPQEQQQRACVLAFLRNGAWRENADFRESQCYLSRNLYPARAHHPSLLRCFPGNKDGAKYHRTFACLIDRIIDRLQAAGQNDLAAGLVTAHCTFVELIGFPTWDDNGSKVLELFRGEVPQGWDDGVDFTGAQQTHRETVLPAWLLNSRRSRPCTVVLPKSVFRVLCQAGWRGLNTGIFNHRMNQFGNGGVIEIDAPHLNRDQPLPGDFQQCRWLVTGGFPYFRGRGLNDEAIGAALTQLSEVLCRYLLADDPHALADWLRVTDFNAYLLHCIEHRMQPDYL
jgi:hypothetical protein